MLTSKENSSQRMRSHLSQHPIYHSAENSHIYKQAFSDSNSKCDAILNTQRSIIKQNLDKLKNLLSENKQFAKKNKADISPERIFHDNSINKFKYCTSNNQRSQKSKIYLNSQQRSRDLLSPNKLDNQSLILDIKRKIKGSPSPSRFQNNLAQGYFTKGIIKPQTVYLYKDDLVNSNKQINLLIKENQNFQSKIQDQNILIDKLYNQISQLQNKLENVVILAQQNEEKFHSMMFDKEEQIRKFFIQKEQSQMDIKSSIQNFINAYLQKIAYLNKKVNVKVSNLEKRMQSIQSKQLKRMNKKVKLQKFIFESQSSYGKSKNILQKSPSVKGDNFSEFELKRHQMEISQFKRQVEYEKSRYQKTIESYKQSYDELYDKFVQAQKRNESLKKQMMSMKNQQQKFIKQYEQTQKRLQEQKKNNQIQQSYFKKQLSQMKIEDDFSMQNKQDLTVKSLLNTPKSIIKSKQSPKSLYLRMNQDISDKSDTIKESDTIKQSAIIKQGHKQVQKIEQSLKLKQKELLQKQIQLELKEKELQLRQKQFQQQIKIKQQYFDQLNHIKNILKTVQESKLQQNKQKQYENNRPKQVTQTQKGKRQAEQYIQTQKGKKSGRSPMKLKELSKVEYLAKKQKKEKQIVKSKLQTLQRQLQYQKVKNNQLQSLIGQKETQLFHQVKEITYKIENQPLCEQMQQSIIYQEQNPSNIILESNTKTKVDSMERQVTVSWQSKVKDKLQNAIQRLQALQQLSSSSRINKKEQPPIQE